jgi:peptide/nickel transport system permease protein
MEIRRVSRLPGPYPTLREPVSVQNQVWRMLRESKTGLIGLGIVLAILLAALFAEPLSPHDPYRQDIRHRLTGPFWITGNVDHVLGSDSLGRDILARIIYGARISLLIGASAVAMSGSIGVTLGLLAGYFRGRWDSIIMRLADIQLAVPTMVFALALMAALGPGLRNVIIVLGITGWVVYARVVRGEVLSVREKEFVEGARAVGASHGRILLFHILPNVSASIIVISSLRVAAMILLEATLSFLGLGVQPPTPTWGGMVAEGRDLIYRAWWVSTFPGIAIVIAILGINLLGDWLRDVLDPRLRT